MNSKAEYDLTRSKRAKDVPHLKKLQEAAGSGKARILIMLDDAVIAGFRARRCRRHWLPGRNHRTLREALQDDARVMLETLCKVIGEELRSD